jgi:hypothetical protein
MKRLLLILALSMVLVAAVPLAGCVRVDIGDEGGATVTKTYDFTGFTGVEVGHAFRVDITQSENYSITITINEKIADRLTVTRSGDTLKIGFKEILFNLHSRPRATITLPDLRFLDLSGAVEGNVKGLQSSHDLDFHISGASSLDTDMEAGYFSAEISGASQLSGYLKATGSDIELSGASHINLTGSGGDIRLKASGASTADLDNYAVADADVELSGAGTASMEINGKLNTDLSGASRLTYGGQPTLGRIDISGGSSLKPR